MTESQFPCKSCGAKLEFKPGTRSLACPYCGHENPIDDGDRTIEEQDFHEQLAALEAREGAVEALTVRCESCAAETTLAAAVTASTCPFCGAGIVATAKSQAVIKPRSLLPFHIARQQAFQSYRGWLSGLWFAPGELNRHALADERFGGVYIPYWTFDSDTTSSYRGERGDDYWDTQHYTTTANGKTVHRTRQVRRTRWRPASGTVQNRFDDVLVLASRSLPGPLVEKLEPWDLKSLVPYSDGYLSGFRAERYQVGLEDGFKIARGIMDERIRASIRKDIGGDHQRIHSVETHHDAVTFKHLLLPVWLSAYRYRNRVYRFLVNARTGEVQGERPWSAWKIALAVLGALAAIGAIAAIVASLN